MEHHYDTSLQYKHQPNNQTTKQPNINQQIVHGRRSPLPINHRSNIPPSIRLPRNPPPTRTLRSPPRTNRIQNNIPMSNMRKPIHSLSRTRWPYRTMCSRLSASCISEIDPIVTDQVSQLSFVQIVKKASEDF